MFGLLLAFAVWFFAYKGIRSYFRDKSQKSKQVVNGGEERFSYDDYVAGPTSTSLQVSPPELHDERADKEVCNNHENEQTAPAKGSSAINQEILDEIVGVRAQNSKHDRVICIGKYLHGNVFSERFYKLDRIPADKARNAVAAMRIGESEAILALLDDTLRGSGKEGIVITDKGLYWKELFEDPTFLSWDDVEYLNSRDQIIFNKSSIVFAGKLKLSTGLTYFDREELAIALRALFNCL